MPKIVAVPVFRNSFFTKKRTNPNKKSARLTKHLVSLGISDEFSNPIE